MNSVSTFKSSSETPRFLAKRYELITLLRDSNGVCTYQARDNSTGELVIVKLAHRDVSGSAARRRLEQKVIYLRQLKSPFIAVPTDFGYENDFFFLVRPFLPGQSLEEKLRKGPLSVAQSILVAKVVLSALAEAHDHQVLHQDVKPANIIIPDSTDFAPTLIDFSCSRFSPAPQDEGVGTIHYISPEQAGSLPHPIDHRSDLYSAGIVLYECLAGSPPFTGNDLGALLRKHLSVVPEPLTKKLKLPRALDNIAQHLLRKDPHDRYQSAKAALFDLEALEGSLAKGDSNPVITIGSRDQRQVLTDPSFVGRNNELQAIRDAFQSAAGGEGGLLFLEAESGGGKSRLLDEFVKSTIQAHPLILRGQGIDQSARMPYQLLVGVADSLCRSFQKNAEFLDRLRVQLKDQAPSLATALPELSALLGDNPASPNVPESYAEMRTLEAFCRLLDVVGDKNQTAIILLDDCQWGDTATLKLLSQWIERRKLSSEPCFLLIIAAYRSDEVPAGHLLRTVSDAPRLELPPLKNEEIIALVGSMAGEVPEAACDIVIKLSSGSPFMAAAVMRGLVESRVLTQDGKKWRINEDAIEKLQPSSQSAYFLSRRLELLGTASSQLLAAGAVLGKKFELETAAHLAGMTLQESIQLIRNASERHILWYDTQASEYSFAHDKLREALLKKLTVEERKHLHLLAAEYLEKFRPDRVLELAYHFDSAGESQRAFQYAWDAARQARTQHAIELAEQQYRIALRGTPSGRIDLQKSIGEGLGDILLLRGEYEEADRQFQSLLEISELSEEKSRILGKLGDVAFKRGDVAKASEFIERALEGLNATVPRAFPTLILFLLWEVAVQVLHTSFPRIFLSRRKPLVEGNPQLTQIRLLSRLAYVYWFQKGKLPCAWAHLREMNLAERHPESPELAQAYSEHAPVMTMVPYFARAIEYAKRSFRIRKDLGDLWGQGQSLHFHGVALYASSQYEEAIEKCTEAAHLLERTGDRWEVNTANWHIAFSLYRLGRIGEAVEKFRFVYHSGIAIGDHQAAAIALSGWSKASGGSAPAELIEQERLRSTGDRHTQFELTQGYAVQLLREGKHELAATVLRQARKMYRDIGFQSEYIAPISAWLCTAIRRQIESAKGGYTPKKLSYMLRKFKRACKEAVRVAEKYPNNLPHVLRERAIYHAFIGSKDRAWKDLEKSAAMASVQGARAELAHTAMVKAKLGMELGNTDAQNDLLSAQTLLEECDGTLLERGEKDKVEESVTLSLVDRFESIIDIGRRFASSQVEDDIYETVRSAAEMLLRGECCQLFIWNEKSNRALPIALNSSFHFSERLIEKAFTEKKATLSVGGDSKGPSESIPLSEIRSAICAPIFVRGKRAACFYVIHSRVGSLFGPLETRLADFIANLAGAALENAQGIEQLHRLNENLAEKMREQKKVEAELQEYAMRLMRSNSDLEQFAYVASHDLKEPLRMVTNYVSLLAEQYKNQLGKDAEEYIGFAEEGAKRMYQLIEALLDYSRVRKTNEPADEVNFNEILKKALSNLKASIEESGAEIESSDLPALPANSTQILQLFQNLLSNAIKFRGTERPKLTIRAEKRPGCWMFEVRDNGIGIEPQHIEKIFTIFYRLHHREAYPGTGIGLAICKKIVLQHGGSIWVESAPGKGSSFFFTIPLTPKTNLKEEGDERTISHSTS